MVNLEWIEDLGWIYLRQPNHVLLKEQASRRYDNKSHKWVPDSAEGFVPAPITVVEGKELTIRMSNNEKVKVNIDDAQSINPAKYDKAEDLAIMPYLNEASVLNTLRQRFSALLTYTYAGSVCIFINPYKRLPIYTDSIATMYIGQRRTEMPPHLFAIADQAYRDMIRERNNNSLIMTGESGSGKTENFNGAIFYYTHIGGDNGEAHKKAVRFQDQVERSLEHRLLEVIHLCETFGNAATGRNANASRHSRYLKLYFNSSGKIAACHIEHFLLEKIRVIKQFPEERSFHIFYQILTNRKICELCLLERDPNKYDYICQAEIRFHCLDDSDEFKHTDKALTLLGFTDTERLSIYKTCAGILYLGQLKTKLGKNSNITFANTEVVRKIVHLFGVNAAEFAEAILKSNFDGNCNIQRIRTEEQVQKVLSSLACTVYSLMFSWIITKFNTILKNESVQEHSSYIGLLDTSGFERYPYNTFERFWINLVNEKVQQYYNEYIFVREQCEYKNENIQWNFIDFGQNLKPCIDIIEKPSGIIDTLNAESLRPDGTDDSVYVKLNASFSDLSPYYRPESTSTKTKLRDFIILHYNGDVRYSIDDWVEKNQNSVDDGIIVVFSGSNANSFMQTLWDCTSSNQFIDLPKRDGCKGGFWTLNKQYANSLTHVLQDLNNTAPHFIRCIVPNDLKQSAVFDGTRVLNQLSSSGVLETLRLARRGFPDRLTFSEFRRRYAIIANLDATEMEDKKVVRGMLNMLLQKGLLQSNDIDIGQTKIFFKYGILSKLEKQREAAFSDTIIRLQSACRSYLARRHYLSLDKERCAVITIQQNIVAWTRKKACHWLRLYFHLKPLIPLLHAKVELIELRQKLQEMEQEKTLVMDSQTALMEQLKEKRDQTETNMLDLEMQRQHCQDERAASFNNLIQMKTHTTKTAQGSEKTMDENVEMVKSIGIAVENSANTGVNDSTRLVDYGVNTEEHQRTLLKLKAIGEELKKKKEAEAVQKVNAEKMAEENERLKKEIKAIMSEMAKKQEIEVSNSNSERGTERQTRGSGEQHSVPKIIISESESPGTSGTEEQENNKSSDAEGIDALRRKCEQLEMKVAELENLNEEYSGRLDSAKRIKDQLTKAKKKLENELQQLSEHNQRLISERDVLEEECKKSETEILEWKTRLNHDADLIAKLQGNTKKLIARIEELESELQNEQRRRLRAEKQRDDLQEELSVVNEQIYETNGQLDAQVQINKLRQIEVNELQREMEERSVSHKKGMADMRSLHWLTLNTLRDLTVQADSLEKEASRVLCSSRRNLSKTTEENPIDSVLSEVDK